MKQENCRYATLDDIISRLVEIREELGKNCNVVVSQNFDKKKDPMHITMISVDSKPSEKRDEVCILVTKDRTTLYFEK